MSGTSQIADARKALLSSVDQAFTKPDIAKVKTALDFAERAHQGQRRGTGEPYVCHPIAVATILAQWQLGPPTVIAALLHDTIEDTPATLADITKEFGSDIAELVESVTKLSTVRVPKEGGRYDVDNIRHLFLAMAKDLRVVLLKLADRLHNMRTLAGVNPDKRRRIGRETIEIYAPLADLLGMGELRSELDDLGFRYADPKEYQWAKHQVQQTTSQRTKYVTRVKREFHKVFAAEGITPEISARTKNTYSLYRKLLQKQRDIDKIYDLFAIRIIVDSIEQCYQGIGIIHRHWKPLPGRMKDYIAMPKLNGYRSLHTTIFGPGDRLLEIQLRTRQMHEEAERGVAAHAIYADRKESVNASQEQLRILKTLSGWQEEARDPALTSDQLPLGMFRERIFVFTPKGSLYNLPNGSTPVDFAYRVHTEVGHACHGAKVNGVIVPLDTSLQNGAVVEILTRRGGAPKRDWLTVVKTAHARSQIRGYFRKQARESNVKAGRELFERARRDKRLTKAKVLSKSDRQKLLSSVPPAKALEDIWAMLGEGSLSLDHLWRQLGVASVPAKPPAKAVRPKGHKGRLSQGPVISLKGMDSLVHQRASCCHPKPGDAIIGYVTVGRGVTIHRADCLSVKNLPDPSRIIQVSWS